MKSPHLYFTLMNGESVLLKTKVNFWDIYLASRDCNLVLTDFRLVFIPIDVQENPEQASGTCSHSHVRFFPAGSIEKVTNSSTGFKSGSRFSIDVSLRQFYSFKLLFATDSGPLKQIYDAIYKMAFPLSVQGAVLPALKLKEDFRTCGWDVYDPHREFSRMGLPNDLWRVTNVNSSYALCSTYPAIVAVPASVSDEFLTTVKEFRSKNRLPVLSWVHPNNQCAITRCSQPLTAAIKHNKDDENYIEEIIKASPSCNKLVIADARPYKNAFANQAVGGGYEDVKNYHNSSIFFYEIANIHVMRESFAKLRDICTNSFNSSNWFGLLEGSKWLDHVSKILTGAVKIAENIDRNRTSVLIHCSDGWDRTAQLSSLAMICLDPYYRTVLGFETLIEKEWCSFGHKFGQRYSVCENITNDEQVSPVFDQFVDCVWQILNQFPCAFQFTENMLIMLLEEKASGWYGTFYYDTEQIRNFQGMSHKTVSIWSAINAKPSRIFNPMYCPERFPDVILPVPTVPYIKLWKSYYLKHNPMVKPKLDYERIHSILTQKNQKCMEMLDKLKKEIETRNATAKNMGQVA